MCIFTTRLARLVSHILKGAGGYILGKSPRERFLAADFLTAHERVNGHRDCAINVMRRAKVGKPHLAKRLGDAHDGFQMADLHMRHVCQRMLYFQTGRKWEGVHLQ